MARYVAKNIVAAGLAERCEVQLAYAIGVPFLVSVMVDTFGTGTVDESAITRAVTSIRPSPAGIISTLTSAAPSTSRPQPTVTFGREGFPWETDKAEALKKIIR